MRFERRVHDAGIAVVRRQGSERNDTRRLNERRSSSNPPGAFEGTRIHRSLAQYEQEKTGVPFKARIGAAAGEPVEDHMDLFGSTVQLAARLCSHAQPEPSLVSNVVAELCIGKGLPFQDLGEVSLKGFERPIRVHAIQHAGS